MASRSEGFILTWGGEYCAPIVSLGVVLILMVSTSMFEVAGCSVSSVEMSL